MPITYLDTAFHGFAVVLSNPCARAFHIRHWRLLWACERRIVGVKGGLIEMKELITAAEF